MDYVFVYESVKGSETHTDRVFFYLYSTIGLQVYRAVDVVVVVVDVVLVWAFVLVGAAAGHVYHINIKQETHK